MNRTDHRTDREAWRREALAIQRLNNPTPPRRRLPWSRRFVAFWLFGLSVIVGALIATAAHATPTPSHAAQVRHAVAVHRAHRLHALKVHARDVRRAAMVRAWTPIATCENGGWNPPQGSAYPDSLGITAANWYANGGGRDLRPFVQAKVAYRIQNPPPVRCPW